MVVGGVEMVPRGLEESDRPFIATTWGRSYRYRAGCPERIYDREHRKVIDRLLGAGRFALMASTEVPRTVFGWACSDERALHYVYVVPELRGRGIAKALLEKLGVWAESVECSHKFSKPNERFIWNPYAIGVCP